MRFMSLLDYYWVIDKEFADKKDVIKLIGCSEVEAVCILNEVIKNKEDNYKYYKTKDNIIIPMYIFIKYFKLNNERIIKYHNSLCEFFGCN